MKDNFGRKIDYMRISVTDRCNLRCKYCMPEGGISTISMSELLSYEEIARVCQIAADLGIENIRLTGGEPLVRLEVAKLVSMIHQIPGIKSITMTTNGILLKDYLEELKESGLSGVNISLDTLDPKTFKHITGQDALGKVLDSIYAALESGICVKVNTVLLSREFYSNEDETWMSMLPLAKELPIDLRFIELMPIGEGKQFYHVTGDAVLDILKNRYPDLREDKTVHGSGPAVYYRIPGFAGCIGLIQAMHGKFCHKCNRIRVSATGKVKPCLCYADTFDIQKALREGTEDDAIAVIKNAILAKPAAHCFEDVKDISEEQKMVSIGG